MMQNSNNIHDLLSQICSWFSKSMFVIVTAFISAAMSVMFQIHTGKMTLSRGKIFSAISLSFGFSILVANVWSYTFGPHYEVAVASATALIGREVVIWIFVNYEAILYGIAERFKIKIKRDGKKKDS